MICCRLGNLESGEITVREESREQKERLVLAKVFAFMLAKTRLPPTLCWEVTAQKEDFFLHLRIKHCFMAIAIHNKQGFAIAAHQAAGLFSQILGHGFEEGVNILSIKREKQYVFLISVFTNNKENSRKPALDVKKVEVVWGAEEKRKAFIELRKKCNSLAFRNEFISFCATAPTLTVVMTFVIVQLNGFRKGSFSAGNQEAFTTVFFATVAVISLLFAGAVIQAASTARDYSFKGSQSFESYQKAIRDLKSGRADFF